MPIEEAQERVNSREFSLWQADYRLNPSGPEADDIRLATLKQFLAACHCAKMSLDDLILSWGNDEAANEALVGKVLAVFGPVKR